MCRRFSSRHETEREFGHLPLAPERARTPFSRAVHSGEKPVGAFCERRGVVALIIKSRLGVVVNVCSRVIFPASVILKMRCYNRAGHRPFSGRQSPSRDSRSLTAFGQCFATILNFQTAFQRKGDGPLDYSNAFSKSPKQER